jgi:hypothetical protein
VDGRVATARREIAVKTRTVNVGGLDFVIAKLTLDQIEEWEKGVEKLAKDAKRLSEVTTAQKQTVSASLSRAGVTDPSAIGKLDMDDLTALIGEILVFSNLVGGDAPAGEAPRAP